MENVQDGEPGLEVSHDALEEISQRTIPMTAHKQRCEFKGVQGWGPLEGQTESGGLSEGFSAAFSKASMLDAPEEKSLIAQYGRKYHPQSELVMVHTGQNPSDCPTVGETIQQECSLDHSQGIQTGEKQDSLTEQPSSHTGEKPYECAVCGQSFSSRSSAKRHQSIHSQRRPYVCLHCGKCFRERHQRIHTGEKPFQCVQCGKCFRERNHVRTHRRIHTGEKPYECPECGRNFSRRHTLTTHHRTHRRQKSYKCSSNRETMI